MTSEASRPSLLLFLRVWLTLAVQSFGGGPATLTLIRRAVVERHRWVSEEEFTRDWALVQLAPGINLLALTILIGRRVAGAAGIAVALCGLLLPSVTLTILITAYFSHVQHSEWTQAALRGVLPATVGIGVLTAFQVARPLLLDCYREGRGSLILGWVLLIGSGLVVFLWQWPVLLALLGAGALGALAHAKRPVSPQETEPPTL